MNLIFFTVFAACACFVNGLHRMVNKQKLLSTAAPPFDSTESLGDDQNNSGEIQIDGEEVGEDTLSDSTENTTAKDDVKLEEKTFKYWPQIVIIKPMANRPPMFGMGGMESLLPNHANFGPSYVHTVNTIKPSSTFTTYSTTTHHTFSTHRPKSTTDHKDNYLPSPEARDHETDEEIAVNDVSQTSGSQAETEATTDSEIQSSESNPCTTPSGGSGDCVSVYNCQVLLNLVNKKDRTSQDVELLKKSQCGYDGSAPAVCCPKNQPQGNCYTPEGNVGQCVSLYSCAHLANMLKPPVPSENIAYVQKSKCEGTEQYSVCCGPPPDRNHETTVVPSGNCNSLMNANPPDPRTECCGVDSRVGNKIVGGNATTVDQYPWLVMIEYVQGTMTKLLCGGVLISGKYVLTAGHCVAGQVLTIGTPKRVRLGEYDISHEGPDCAAVEAGGEDCTEGVTRILIEKIIPHPQYNPVSPLKRNDIALLRLKESAPFTDFIRPICLPSKDLTAPENVPANFSLYAAGWGAVSDRKSYSNVKLHVDLPFVNPEKCQPVYSFPGRSVPLWKGQMCAGGVNGKDSCKGDSGGPLMYEDGRTYEVIGIVSFGPVPCGMEGVPGVYSKVYEYLGWIRSTIVP